MAADDLDTPLGSARNRRSSQRRSVPAWPLIAVTLAVVIVFILVWTSFVDDPLGGEPMAVATIESAAPVPGEPVDTKSADTRTSGRTVTIIDGKSGARIEVPVSGESVEPAGATIPTLDPRVVEPSSHGPIPRIGPDGVRPLDVFARADARATSRNGPRIAIVLAGLGIGARMTEEAIATLPAAITLAFAPFDAELTRWAGRAREAGHEILLQIPMEPFDYPDNDPGPRTLLTKLSAEQNLDRLHWSLSRVQGYVGVTSFMGERFTANENALGPVVEDLAGRGLLYFDAAGSSRSIAKKLAAHEKMPFLQADLVVDRKPSWSEIDAALERLERVATEQGFAVGLAEARPVAIERLARWVKAAENRGIRIVPLSALAARPGA